MGARPQHYSMHAQRSSGPMARRPCAEGRRLQFRWPTTTTCTTVIRTTSSLLRVRTWLWPGLYEPRVPWPQRTLRQACVVAAWMTEEYEIWEPNAPTECGGNGSSPDWRGIGGIGHFTAAAWKPMTYIGCSESTASSGSNYWVCNYGAPDVCGEDWQNWGGDCMQMSPRRCPTSTRTTTRTGADGSACSAR